MMVRCPVSPAGAGAPSHLQGAVPRLVSVLLRGPSRPAAGRGAPDTAVSYSRATEEGPQQPADMLHI